MNLFTHVISKKIKDRRLHEFIRHWDVLEAMVIQIYKDGQALEEDDRVYQHLRGWLQKHYPVWKKAFAPLWADALLAGLPAQEDPFEALLDVERADGFIGNWRMLQTLPAAREALNRYLLKIQSKA